MNPVLEHILTTRSVSDGQVAVPLADNISREEGEFLAKIIRDVKPRTSVEIGLGYGVSTLYICDALVANGLPARHIVMDPFQSTRYRSIGLRNITQAGYSRLIEFHEEPSEFQLPRLNAEGLSVEFALVDGWHSFDQVMVEFYYINRLLRVGGVVAFDDANRRNINRVIRHALTYPAYEVYDARRGQGSGLTWAGVVRQAMRRFPRAEQIFREDLLYRDWDLGVFATFVALRKVAEDNLSERWDPT
jgi:predicted O-methyltransferase YrrM